MKGERKSIQNIFDPQPQVELCIDSPGERLKIIITDLPTDKVTGEFHFEVHHGGLD
jgi:hypothetical protein